MRHTSFFIAMIASTLLACGQNTPQQPEVIPVSNEYTDQQLLEDIGEMLLVGFRGTTISPKSHIVRDIQQYHVGSIILFEYDAPTGTRHRNVESPDQLRKLCTTLQQYAGGNLLIGIDQEGGNVVRMRSRDGFPRTMSAQASAQAGYDSVTNNAAIIARELADAGVNLNFAPCVDVNVNPACPVIGKLGRSFSKDPNEVTKCASLWIKEASKLHIISCLKHFPGHGSASGDTHAGLVDVSSTWQESELQPYRDLIASGSVDMVMVAHVINRTLGDDLPASLSPAIVNELLRNQFGFTGVIVTDDLAMGAITNQYGFEEALRLAILAGCDLLCLSNNGGGYNPDLVPKAVDAIFQLVKSNQIPAESIQTSAQRIRSLKKKINLDPAR